MDNIALLILGVFISFLGIVNIMGNISTIHSYNRRKVKEEDVPKYGRAVGTGTLIIGASLIAAFVTAFWSEKARRTFFHGHLLRLYFLINSIENIKTVLTEENGFAIITSIRFIFLQKRTKFYFAG